MKVLFVAFRHNPLNKNSGSGASHQFYKSICGYGHEVRIIGPFNHSPILIERLLQYFYQKLKKKYLKYKWTSTIRASYALNKMDTIWKPDIIFSLTPSPFFFYKGKTPYVIRTDTTFLGMNSQAANYLLHDNFLLSQMVWQERKAFSNCSMIITHSNWSKKILKNYYQVNHNLISVLPNPAAISYINSFDNHKPIIKDNFKSNITLLLVGRDYHRKGIDIAIKTINLLNKKGFNSHLNIVGSVGLSGENYSYHGIFDKTKTDEYDSYIQFYKNATFLLHPARFDASPIVTSEAAAFGTPTITNNCGGLSTSVEHGISGIVLPKNSSPDSYVSMIIKLIKTPNQYFNLCKTTRLRYERELHWGVVGKSLNNILDKYSKQKINFN